MTKNKTLKDWEQREGDYGGVDDVVYPRIKVKETIQRISNKRAELYQNDCLTKNEALEIMQDFQNEEVGGDLR